MWWSWPGVRGRAALCSPPSPRRCRGQCVSCVLQLYCWRRAEDFWVGIFSGCCHSYPSGHLSQKLETLCLDLDELWRMVWLVAGPVYKARGVRLSAVSWCWGSHSSPFPVPGPGTNLGGKRWWHKSQSFDVGRDTALSWGPSGFYFTCWLAHITSSWLQPPEPQPWLLKSPGGTLYLGSQVSRDSTQIDLPLPKHL